MAAANKLFFDEAGNSGDNLLDPDQPCYLLLSHNFSEDETCDILTPLLAVSKAKELHFTNIKKYESQRNALLACFQNALIQKGRAHFYVAHKQFMIYVQMVDKLIEPVLFDGGVDIYRGGSNLSTANLLNMLATNRWDPVHVKRMNLLFVRWVRSAKKEDEILFYEAVNKLYVVAELEEEKMLLGFILLSRKYLKSILKSFEKYSLDATLPCMIEHCHYWSEINDGPFEIIFDTSKQLDYWRGMIDFLTFEIPEAEVGYGSRKHRYPLPINSIQTLNSTDSLPLQLADLFASALNYFYTYESRGAVDAFADQLFASNLKKIWGNTMWPSTHVTPAELNMEDESGQNALDFFADAVHRNPAGYTKIDLTKK